jgi:manganese-dependent ADP-ribose/CDP-alcohol diphosphatase
MHRQLRSGMTWLLLAAVCAAGNLYAENARPPDITTQRGEPLFRFGVVADVQYADKDPAGKRHYRESAGKLKTCIGDWNRQDLAFVVNLGDLIDGNGARTASELEKMVDLFKPLKAPVHHVIGNHCLAADRATLMKSLGLRTPWYDFSQGGWRFIALFGMDVSVYAPKGSDELKRARDYLARSPKLPTYNGAIGPRQMEWFKQRLADAKGRREHVVVFCHHPICPAATKPDLLLWNHDEVEQVVAGSGCVVAWICGHDHEGGYARQKGIHHLTMPGMIESPTGGNGYGVVEVFNDRLVVKGVGTVPNRTLDLAQVVP